MQIQGSYRLAAGREQVWQALNDPGMLQRSLPGCESLVPRRDGTAGYDARLVVKVGPIKARFDGQVEVAESNGRDRLILRGTGAGGLAGFASGQNTIELVDAGPTATDLSYVLGIEVGGRMASLGAKTLEPVVKRNAEQFFERFSAVLAEPAQVQEAPTPERNPDSGSIAVPAPERLQVQASGPVSPDIWVRLLRRERYEGVVLGSLIGAAVVVVTERFF